MARYDLSTSEAARRYIAEFFATEVRRHDFTNYIATRLAADFACALAQHLAATGKQQVGEVQGDARAALESAMPYLETLHSIVGGEARTSVWRCIERGRLALAARQPEAQPCTNCDRTDAKVICETCAGLAWDTGRLHEFSEIRELSTSLGEGALDDLVPEEWHEKPLLRFQGAYDCGDNSVGVPARSGHVLATDQAGTVLGDYLAARAAKEGGQ
ncbi:hypothetical protein BIZ42_16135 [Stenotrophomonas sp. LM091]|nr:hypothetical protein BIZ42_16135 [Stenotrophomonas sp. LM091]